MEVMRDETVSCFVESLPCVPWFEQLGEEVGEGVARIHSWDEWPGPEQEAVAALMQRGQRLYDALVESIEPGGRIALRDDVRRIVFRHATSKVPYDESRDSWHAPTAAVWHAAFTAELVAMCVHASHDVPPQIAVQWTWFQRGHWPCGYSAVPGEGEVGELVVF